MRTKTLLIAAAAMAAGLVTSQAQVYSQNVVGYVNTPLVGSGLLTLVANPLTDGTNTITSLLDATLPNKSSVTVFNPLTAQFTAASKISGVWNTNIYLPPGVGFFVKTPNTSGALTNTFVGSVVVGPGATNSMALINGLQLVGSPVPLGGLLSDTGTNTLNIGGTLPNKSSVTVWNSGSQTFTVASLIGGVWNTNLPISVGQGFYINSKAATNWNQSY